MTLIIDTCNVLHRTGILPPELAGIDERGLVSLVLSSRYRNRGAILACDGKPRDRAISRGTPGITLHFPRPGETADELIMALIARSSAPKRLLVITSDREVASAARKRRCRILDSDSFLGHLAHDADRSARNHTDQTVLEESGSLGVEDWIDQFQLDDQLKGLAASEPPPPRPRETEDTEPAEGDPALPPKPPTPPSQEPWEALDTDELLRRYERGGDEPGTQA